MTRQNNEIRLTVFTPAYNRAHTLPRTYESLCRQSCKDFIWMLVDDGSTDNTAELIKEWQQRDNGFEIRYLYKENGGMHTAHNTAYANIDTELNVCIDSDDAMGDDAVRKILEKWAEVQDKGYAGIIGLDADFDGNVIGKGFPDGMTETSVIGYYAAGGRGDKKLVYRTDIINHYPPYPVFPGEKYVALSYKYRLIDQDYKMAVLDEILCNVEYQADGSSKNMLRQYARNPKGFAFWRKVCMQYPISKKRLFLDCVHYVSSSILGGEKHFLLASPEKGLTLLALLPGIIFASYIKKRINRNRTVVECPCIKKEQCNMPRESVSVIIPVHNGSSYIKRTLKNVLLQKECDLEIICVENFSSDNSTQIIERISEKDKRVKVFHSFEPGTSFARRLGVEKATGDFIVFCDQDDGFVDCYAVSKMINSLIEDKAEICQFGYYKMYFPGIKKTVKRAISNNREIFTREDILNRQIKGILGFGWDSSVKLNTTVWNKCYRASVLKNAVKNINCPVFFAEDSYFNMWAFFEKEVTNVSVRNDCYYIWKTGGYSSSEAAQDMLLKDMNYTKPAAERLLIQNQCDTELILENYWDTLTVYRWTVFAYLYKKKSKEETIDFIEKVEQYPCIITAKTKLRTMNELGLCKCVDMRMLAFQTSDYSSDEFYEWCASELPQRSRKAILRNHIARVLTRVRKTLLRW